MSKNKVVLIIRDGYGLRDEREDNAVVIGNTPYTDYLMEKYPTTTLRTSGNDVGLPDGYMGGSEVGHMTIGSGRIIWQNLELINRKIKSKEFFENKSFLELITYAKEHNKAVHLMGLLQNQGVHAHQDHLFALMEMCKQVGIEKEKVRIHIFSDGRDSPPQSLPKYLEMLEEKISEIGVGVISSLVGRYYAMDRDTRWDRTQLAFNVLSKGEGEQFDSIYEAIKESYSKEVFDEFITPKVIGDFTGMYPEDVVLCYNYRTDRMRQIVKAFVESDFSEFNKNYGNILHFGIMTSYYDNVNAKVAFYNEIPKNILGEVIANNNLKQLRISETEKFPHVTFFFNGQLNEPFSNENRTLIPSPRDVATYDLKPEMSIYNIKDSLLKEMENEYDLIVVNYVNGDMVGHTGKLEPAIKAVECVDECVEETVKKGLELGYDFIIFADHGNCEEMAGIHQTSHTLNDVDCILVSNKEELQKEQIELRYGGLKDIAPTALELLQIEVPQEMEGQNLIIKKDNQ